MITEYKVKTLLAPRNTTDAGVTGAYIDTYELIGAGKRQLKFVLTAGVGLTDGTFSGSIQSAELTDGTGLATLVSFAAGLTSANDVNVVHGVLPASHRYVRLLGSVQTAKNMILGGVVVGVARQA